MASRPADMAGLALADAAEALIGAPFRLHGRDPETGLDCVGVCAVALQRIGRQPDVPNRYALRNSDISEMLPWAARAGLAQATGAPVAGDILLVRLSAVQFHLLIAAGGEAFIHAHAGLRRVVRGPLPRPAEPVRLWRLG